MERLIGALTAVLICTGCTATSMGSNGFGATPSTLTASNETTYAKASVPDGKDFHQQIFFYYQNY